MTDYYRRNVQQVNNTPTTGHTWTGKGGSTVDKGGVIRFGGNIAHQDFTSKAVVENVNQALVGSHVYLSNTEVKKAVSGGNFATQPVGHYVIRKVTTSLAGVANTHLKTGCSDFGIRRSIHKTEAWRTSFLYRADWVVSAATLESPGANYPSYTFYYSDQLTSFGQNSTATNPDNQGTQDSAARPTLAVPGVLVYKAGSPTLVVMDTYKAKTQG